MDSEDGISRFSRSWALQGAKDIGQANHFFCIVFVRAKFFCPKQGPNTTVESKIFTPEKLLYFSELIRRGVMHYAGNFLPQIIFVELIMRGNSVSHYVDRLFFWGGGGFNYSKKSNGN